VLARLVSDRLAAADGTPDMRDTLATSSLPAAHRMGMVLPLHEVHADGGPLGGGG